MLRFLRDDSIRPQNMAERVIWWAITWTYPIWLVGGLYIVGSVVGWLLLLFLLVRVLAQDETTPESERVRVSWVIWLWIAGMAVMEVALIAGHLDYSLGMGLMIKSTIGWAKGWAALALYPLAGCQAIRPQLLYRAACILGLHTLLVAPVLLLAPMLHLPQVLYVSPLRAVGGPSPAFFDVALYEIDPGTGDLRSRLFTPWGPALGFVGNVYFVLALQERNAAWKAVGLAGCIVMCLVCKSRLAQVALLLVPLLSALVGRLTRPLTLIVLGIGSTLAGILAPALFLAAEEFWDRFKGARANSTRVRMALKRIAVHRWETEAPIWGHGVVEEGPHVVERMPIGSHHTWAGLLFIKGIVGFVALAIPMAATLLVTLAKAAQPWRYPTGGVGLSIIALLFLYTFGENLESLVYLYWPGMVVLGLALQETPQPRAVGTMDSKA